MIGIINYCPRVKLLFTHIYSHHISHERDINGTIWSISYSEKYLIVMTVKMYDAQHEHHLHMQLDDIDT